MFVPYLLYPGNDIHFTLVKFSPHCDISFTPGRILVKFWSNVWFKVMMCRTHDSECWVKVTVEGREFEPLISCPLHITFINCMVGLVFHILFNSISVMIGLQRVIMKGSVSAVMCYLSLQRSLSPAGFNPGTP